MSTKIRPSLVVAFNLEDPENNSLELGLNTARQWAEADVHVVYVITTAHLYAYEGDSTISQQESALSSAPDRLMQRVTEVANTLFGEGPRPNVSVHVRVGDADEVILQMAVDYEADVIVVGTHDRKGLERLLLGSVAQAVCKQARCSVLVSRAADYSGLEKTPRMDPPGAAPTSNPDRKTRKYSFTHTLDWTGAPPYVR